MPFVTVAGEPLTALPLVYRMGRDFQLAEPFAWVDPRDTERVTIVPAHDLGRPPAGGNGTDFASVPPFLWGLLASYGKQTLPAILHDAQADAARRAPSGDRLELRRTADETFRIALIDAGVHQLRARVMWAAVGMERYARYGGVRGWVIIGQVVVGVLALIASVVLGVRLDPVWFGLVIVPGVASIPWTRDADLVVAATYLGALYSPLVAAAFVAARLEQLLALVVWLVTGRPGPVPRAQPTLRWPPRVAPLTGTSR